MNTLSTQTCHPIPSGTAVIGADAAAALLRQLDGWAISDNGLCKTFDFADHYEATAFLAAAVWVSHRQDHHPDVTLGYNKVAFRYSTHTVGGLSENDFICAARLDALMK